MPTYVCLVNYTDEGIKNVGDTVARTDRGADIAQKHGVKLEQAYWTVGPYDMVVVFEAPDDQAITAHLLEVASSMGTVRTITLRAFDREEVRGIIERLGSWYGVFRAGDTNSPGSVATLALSGNATFPRS